MIAGIVLAAGLSRRMGRPKLLLELQGKPVMRQAVEGVVPHVGDLIVVGPDDAAGAGGARGLTVRLVVNPPPEDGQGTSVAAGVSALAPATEAALIALGDQPRCPPTSSPRCCGALSAPARPSSRRVPRRAGQPRALRGRVFPELLALTGDRGRARWWSAARAAWRDSVERDAARRRHAGGLREAPCSNSG